MDARGEVEHGMDVVEFACGIEQLLKVYYSDEQLVSSKRNTGILRPSSCSMKSTLIGWSTSDRPSVGAPGICE
jgi:hypothetical protein